MIMIYVDVPGKSAARLPSTIRSCTIHTHAFHVPLEPSPVDEAGASFNGDEDNFILGFGYDGHVELAWRDKRISEYRIERENQQLIAERLSEAGLLVKIERSSKEIRSGA